MSDRLAHLIRNKRMIVCCGAGGVGKTTVSAALALAAARAGRRVLVVTIDPSKRLAETLGVARNPPEPVTLPDERLREVGVEPPGSLSAWMLDPQVVADSAVRRLSRTPEEARVLLHNRIYASVTDMVAGLQEYTAVEAMHGFVVEGDYDLVVLDTPPSRNALHFLDAPSRMARFLDGRIFRFFVPGEGGFVKKTAAKIINRVFDIAFGQETRIDLMTFFGLFSGVFKHANRDAAEMQQFFRRPDSAFLVVTSPTQESLEEARYFENKTRDDLEMPLAGFILNRSLALHTDKRPPDAQRLAAAKIAPETIAKLNVLAEQELERATAHAKLLDELRARVGNGGLAEATPFLAEGVEDLDTLRVLVDALDVGQPAAS